MSRRDGRDRDSGDIPWEPELRPAWCAGVLLRPIRRAGVGLGLCSRLAGRLWWVGNWTAGAALVSGEGRHRSSRTPPPVRPAAAIATARTGLGLLHANLAGVLLSGGPARLSPPNPLHS